MYRISNFTNNDDIKVLNSLGPFTVIEYQRDLSVMPHNAALAYFCNEMNVRKRQAVSYTHLDVYKRQILLCNSDDQKEKELANLQMLAQLQADGVILMTNTGEKSQSYEAVSMPIVFVDRRLDEMGQTSVIEADHYAGGKLAAEYLIACGCRQITCIRGPQELSLSLIHI